jgi:hypothetical protein
VADPDHRVAPPGTVADHVGVRAVGSRFPEPDGTDRRSADGTTVLGELLAGG